MRAVLCLAAACAALAQPPVKVDYRCTPEDMHWAGMSCTAEEPCPVYLELADVEAVGDRIFIAGNLHLRETTLYSILLASADAGKTWAEAHPRLRASGIDHIQFFDFETGWISGGLLHPLAQDPFFLITNDGGKTWRRRPMFDDARPGSIQQFWFSSKQDGAALVDGSRFSLYESRTGGGSWTVREVSDKPLKLKRPGMRAEAWRVRADAASKTYHLERLGSGGQWAAIALFPIEVSQCKPPETVEPQ